MILWRPPIRGDFDRQIDMHARVHAERWPPESMEALKAVIADRAAHGNVWWWHEAQLPPLPDPSGQYNLF